MTKTKKTTKTTMTIKGGALSSLFRGTLIGIAWSAFTAQFSDLFVWDSWAIGIVGREKLWTIALLLMGSGTVATALVVWLIDARVRKSLRLAQFR